MKSSGPSSSSQQSLLTAPATPSDLPERFRKIYFHLYSNSDTSRAERLVTQLALVLLSKYAVDLSDNTIDLDRFIAGEGSANSLFPPLVRRMCPDLAAEDLRFVLPDQLLRQVFNEIADLNLRSAPAHVVGEAFQALIGPRIRGDKGQFFTPRSMVRAMVEIIAPTLGESVLDPACGTGGFLGETHAYRQNHEGSASSHGPLVGIEKDHDLYMLATAMLHLATGGTGRIRNANSLTNATFEADSLRLSGGPDKGFDVVLTNPPFGTKIGIKDKQTLSKFDFGRQWTKGKDGKWMMSGLQRTVQDPQILFLEYCVRALKPGGRMGIVLPEGVFGNRSQGYVWEWLLQMGEIVALMDCPRTSFQPGTDTKTNVLFFRRRAESGERRLVASKPRVAVAIHCGHDRRGRTERSDGSAHPDDFPRLARTFHDRTGQDWYDVEEFQPGYYVPRYYLREVDQTPEEHQLTAGAEMVTLRELIETGLLTITKGHEPGSEAYGTGTVPFVRTSDLANFEVRADPTKCLSEAIFKKFSAKQNLQPHDILMVVDGRYRIGSTAMLHDHDYRCVVQSHLRVLRVNDKTVLGPYHLLFALHLPSVHQRLRNLVFIQSTLGTLGRRLLELRLPLLTGSGPWTTSVSRFQEALEGRAEMLSQVKGLVEEDVEL